MWIRREVAAVPSVFVCIEEVVMILGRGLPSFVPEVPIEVFPHILLVLRELERRAQSASVGVGRSALYSFVDLLA